MEYAIFTGVEQSESIQPPSFFGEPLEYLKAVLESDPGIKSACTTEFLTTNETVNIEGFRHTFAENMPEGTKHVVIKSCNSDSTINIGYGDHKYPNITGSVNIRHKCPDIFLEDIDSDTVRWDRVLPVVEGYVCRPVVSGLRTYAINASQHAIVGEDGDVQIGVLDFSNIGDVTCVPLSLCVADDVDNRTITLPAEFSMAGKSVMAVVQGRLLGPNRITVSGQSLHISIDDVEAGYQNVCDEVMHGGSSPHHSNYYPSILNYQYIHTDEFINDSFIVIVDTPALHVTEYSVGNRIGRHKFICNGLVSGVLKNSATGLLCHCVAERHTESQLVLMKSGKRYYPNHAEGVVSNVVYNMPTGSEEPLNDSDMCQHVMYCLFATGTNE